MQDAEHSLLNLRVPQSGPSRAVTRPLLILLTSQGSDLLETRMPAPGSKLGRQQASQLHVQVSETKHAPFEPVVWLLLQLLLQQMVQSQSLMQGRAMCQGSILHALAGLKPQVHNQYAASKQTPCPAQHPGQR